MKAKKVLAVALSLALLIGLLPIAGLLPVVAEEATVEVTGTETLTVYVSDSATAAAAGDAAETPTTLADALTRITEAEPTEYGSGKIIVVDSLSIPADTVLDAAGKALTITSEGDTAATVTLNSVVDVTSDLTLGKLKVITNGTGYQRGFALGGVNFTTTSEFESGFANAAAVDSDTSSAGNGFTIYTGIDANPTAKNTIVLNGGKIASVTLGGNDAKATLNGVDLTVTNTLLKAIYLFSRGGDGATVFNGDVNITFNSGAIMDGDCFHALSRASVMNEGYALNVIKTSGAACTKTALDGTTNDACNLNDHYYFLNVAADGGTLTPAGAASFVVSGAKVAQAVGSGIDADVLAENGTLTLTTPGVYNVSFIDSKVDKTIYLDPDNGSDTLGNGYTAATAYKTITAAIADADHRESAEIRIIGTTEVQLPKNIPYTAGGLTIRGDDPAVKAHVSITGTTETRSSLKLDNMYFVNPANVFFYLISAEHALTFETTSTFESGFASFDNVATPKVGNGPILCVAANRNADVYTNKIILGGGYFKDIVFGNGGVTTSIAGAEMTVDGAKIDRILISNRNKTTDVTYTKDINLTLKSGSASGIDVWKVSSFDNAALNVIKYAGFTLGRDNIAAGALGLNEGEADKIPNIPYYMLKAPTGGNVSFIDGGVLAVSKGMKATDGDVSATSDGGELYLPVPGVYTGEWLSDTTPLTVYVSEGGTGNGTSTSDTANWTTAFALLKGRESGTIKLVGAVTLPEEIPAVTAGELLITSADGTQIAATMAGHVAVKNDIKLDNMKVTLAGENTVNDMDYAFYIYDADLKTTASFASGEATGLANTARVDQRAPYINFNENTTDKVTIELKGGTFGMVNMANKLGAVTLGPIDVIVDGNVQLQDISFDRYGNNTTTYTGDINLFLKNGSIVSGGYGIGARGNKGTVADGVKIDIFKYAGFTWSNTDIVNIIASQTGMYSQVLAARRWIEVGNGGTITPDGEGSFDAIADMNGYRAMLSDEEKALRYSAADKLPIPDEAGHYTVEWRKHGGIFTVYVQDGAAETNTGWTSDSPVTFDKALTLLQGQEAGVIRLVGDVTLPTKIPETTAGSITITKSAAVSATPVATMGEALQVYNDLILDDVKLLNPAPNSSNNSLYKTTIELNGVYFETTDKFQSGFLTTAPDAAAANANGPFIFLRSKGSAVGKSTLLLRGGYFNDFYFGGNATTSTEAELAGADVTIDGARIKRVLTWHRGTKPTYTDDLNLILKSGSVSSYDLVSTNQNYNAGASFNIIKHSTANINLPTSNLPGSYYFLQLPAEVTDVTIGEEMGQFFFEPADSNFGTSDGTAKTYRSEMVIPANGAYTIQKLADTTGDNTPDTTLPEGKVVYISADGAGYKDGTSPENAYDDERASWVAACKTAPISNVLRIKIVGNGVTFPTVSGTEGHLKTPNASTKLIVESADPDNLSQVHLSGRCNIRGDVTLDNMLVGINSGGSDYFDMYSSTATPTSLTIGAGFKSGWKLSNFAAAVSMDNTPQIQAAMNNAGNSSSAPVSITLRGGSIREVILGTAGNATNIKGVTLTVDGADAKVGAIELGNRNATSATYSGNIDIILKNGSVVSHNGTGKYFTTCRTDGKTICNKGVAVRVLQSNTFNIPANATPTLSYVDTADTTTVVPFYRAIVPAELMDAFDIADSGVAFNFAAPNKTLVATRTYNVAGTAETAAAGDYEYTAGVLTLNSTGVYTVEVDKGADPTGAKDIYVDSELGDDLIGDGTRTNPYKTLTTAINDATGREAATIYVRGEVTLETAIPALTGGMSIVGISEYTTEIVDDEEETVEVKAVISITQVIDVNTDLTLDNVKLLATVSPLSQYDRTGFVINGIEFTTTNTVSAGWDISAPNAAVKEGNGPNLFIYSGANKPVVNINGGNFASIWPGYSPTSTATTEIVLPGAEINLNTRAASLFIGNRKNRSIKFTDDLVITTRNTGNIQQMSTQAADCATTTSGIRHRLFDGDSTIKIYDYTENGIRNGAGSLYTTFGQTNTNGTLCADCLAGIMRFHWIHMPVSVQEKDTYYLEETATAGTYTVHGDKIGLVNGAANGDGSVGIINKTLTVTPGVHKALTLVDFDELPKTMTANQFFLGWKKAGGYVRADNLPSGEHTLTPGYQTLSADIQTLFDIHASQIREEDAALRVMVKMDNDFYAMLTDNFSDTERGMVLITNAMLGGDELTLEGRYAYKNGTYIASKVVAKNLMNALTKRQNDGYSYYNATLKNINAANYKLAYAYRGYVTYTDKNGVKQTIYSAPQSTASIFKSANTIAEADRSDAIKAMITAVNEAGDPSAMYKADGTQNFNPASLYMSKTSKAAEINTVANAIRNKVLTSTDRTDLHITGEGVTTYYISGDENASDENAGTSMDAPLRTTNNSKIYAALQAGNCNILFKRGYVYRESALMVWGSNVFIGAYGDSGFKPILVGSDKNYAEKAEDWTLVENTADIWKADVTEIMDHDYATKVIPENAGNGTTVQSYVSLYASDIGAIVFDHGRMMASTGKVMSNDKELINDFNDELVGQQLVNDYDFYCNINPEDGKYYVYLKLSGGNPAEQFAGIEMLPNRYIVYANNTNGKNIRVDNLSLKYSSDGVGTSGVDDVSITNCEMGYMGGSIFDSMGDDINGDGEGDTPSYQRHGNGITLYGKIDGALVENNWVYQCYDDAYTNQADLDTQENITVKDNLFEYSLYGMTMWTGKHHSRKNVTMTPEECGKDYLRNITVEGNVLRFAGYGHGTFNRGRFGSSTVGATHISVGSSYSWLDNVVIKDNYFDTSYRYLARTAYYGDASEYVFIGNTWNHKPYSRPNDLADVLGTTAVVARVQEIGTDGTIVYYGATENEVYTSVNAIDVAPKAIYFDGKLVTEAPSK